MVKFESPLRVDSRSKANRAECGASRNHESAVRNSLCGVVESKGNNIDATVCSRRVMIEWLSVLALAVSVRAQTTSGCAQIGRGSSIVADQLRMPSATFTFDAFFKFTDSPQLGDRVLALRGLNSTVSLNIDLDALEDVNFAVSAGTTMARTRSARLPLPHQWYYFGVYYNATSRQLLTYLNGEFLTNPITLSTGFAPTALVLGDNSALLVDFARFAPGLSSYVSNLFHYADFADRTVTHSPLLAFDSLSAPVVVGGTTASTRTLADVSVGTGVKFDDLCGARRNFATRTGVQPIAIDAVGAECAWGETGTDTYALFEKAPGIISNLRLLWDDANLYVFVVVQDASPAPDITNVNDFRTDSIELFVASSRELTATIGRFLIVQDPSSNDAALTTASYRSPQGGSWRIEVRIPWSAIGWSPSSSSPLLMLFATNDHVNSSFTGQVDNVGARFVGSFAGSNAVYSHVTLLPGASQCVGTAPPTTTLPPPPTSVSTPTTTGGTSGGTTTATTTTTTIAIGSGSNSPTSSGGNDTSGGDVDGSELPLALPYLIGIGVGGCLFLLLLIALIVWCVACRRKRRRKESDDDYAPSAVMMQSAAPQGAYESPAPFVQQPTKNLYDVAGPEPTAITYEQLGPTNDDVKY